MIRESSHYSLIYVFTMSVFTKLHYFPTEYSKFGYHNNTSHAILTHFFQHGN